MSESRIAVVGTGANGASIAADLTRAGLDPTLIEQWPEHVEAMRSNGVRVEMPDRTETTEVRTLHLCEVATLREQFDLVYMLVKAYDTRWACELIKPHLKADGLIVGLQNGMTIDDMADVMGPHRTLGSVIEVTSNMFVPGVVNRQTPPEGSWFAIGSLGDATRGREMELAEPLSNAGTVDVVDDIRSAKWMKLVVNSAELVPSAILNLPLHEAARLPGFMDFMLAAGKEAIHTAVELGRKVVPILGMPDFGAASPDEVVEQLLGTVMTDFALESTITTVLQDWMKGRHSEVNELNGHVVREQRKLGGSAPLNALVVDVAQRIERGEIEADPANLDLLVGARV